MERLIEPQLLLLEFMDLFTDFEDRVKMLNDGLFFNGGAMYTTRERLLNVGFTQEFIDNCVGYIPEFPYEQKQLMLVINERLDFQCCIGFNRFYIIPNEVRTDSDFIHYRDIVNTENDRYEVMENENGELQNIVYDDSFTIFKKVIYEEYEKIYNNNGKL